MSVSLFAAFVSVSMALELWPVLVEEAEPAVEVDPTGSATGGSPSATAPDWPPASTSRQLSSLPQCWPR